MNFTVKQISSLEKVRPCGIGDVSEIYNKTLMRGETFSYQIAMETTDNNIFLKPSVISPLKDHVEIFEVKNAVMDFPTYNKADDDYITKAPGLMPDILMPLNDENDIAMISKEALSFWIRVNVPKNIDPGKYEITVAIEAKNWFWEAQIKRTLVIDVIPAEPKETGVIFTQWFYADCIADVHNVEVYSDKHWELIDKYMALASGLGINMILTPVITPPLDTEEGKTRTCVQLVRIKKENEKYIFDFSLLKKWIALAKKNNIYRFEISHLFSQWGLKFAPNIMVEENGKEYYMFGWHTAAKSAEYKAFLEQFLPSLVAFLKEEGVKDNCWFHISDEPGHDHLDAYKYARDLIVPLIDGCRTFDANSTYEFYKTGLIQNSVTAIDHIGKYIENKAENLWGYYCCSQHSGVGNRFLAMPSYRNRILGLQIYKFDLSGFLQWGYNFYNSQFSHKKIDPYITTSADKAFPSGDPFSVYPIKDGVVPSLRAVVFKEALDDIGILKKLEEFIGREAVVRLIDDECGYDLTFESYPRNSAFIPELMEKMEKMIKSFVE